MRSLVDDLLEVSRLTAGKIKLRKERVELRVIVEHAMETSRPLIDARRHRLTPLIPDKPIWLYADPARVEQIVVNLLTNAAKYTPEGGEISLTLHQEENQAVVRVRDTGIGITPELLPRIFDLFTQADQALDRSQGGLGVGLALVKALVEMHNGRVQARSAGLDQGSEFIVGLPLQVVSETEQPPASTPIASCQEGLRVLVVDDNMDAADSLAVLLRLARHEVWVAYSGPGAIEAALNRQPHVILLDIGLPGLNGYQVAQRLREHPQTRNAVVIAMTGYGQEADKQEAKDAGFDYHLVKPVDPTQLKDLLALLVDGS